MLITITKSPYHLLYHILNSRHTTSTIPRSNLTILRWNIGPTPIIYVTIVTPVEVVIATVITISNIMTLSFVITIVSTLISLTLVPIILVEALGVWCQFSLRWFFRKVVHHIYLFCTSNDVLQHQRKLSSHLSHFFSNLICGWVVYGLHCKSVSPSI